MYRIITIACLCSIALALSLDDKLIENSFRKKSKIKNELKNPFSTKSKKIFYLKYHLNDKRAYVFGDDEITRQINPYQYTKCVKSVLYILNFWGEASGSGSFIDNGDIITNAHVVDGADSVIVILHDKEYTTLDQMINLKLNDRRIIPGIVTSVDYKRDLALIKIPNDYNNYLYPPVELGQSYNINIGEEVFAIGHPNDNIWTYTTGVISGIRTPEKWSYSNNWSLEANVIQTQTPINPGNSGGPLFNSMGKMIGINSMGDMTAQGLNFAIRIDEVKDFVNRANQGEYPKGERIKEPEWEEIDIKNTEFESAGSEKVFAIDYDNDNCYDEYIVYIDFENKKYLSLFNYQASCDKYDIMLNPESCYWIIDEDADGTFDLEGTSTYDNKEGCLFPERADLSKYNPN